MLYVNYLKFTYKYYIIKHQNPAYPRSAFKHFFTYLLFTYY